MNFNEEISRLFELYHDTLYKQCLYRTGYNPQYVDMIDDCIQYAFMKAMIKREKFLESNNPVGWLSITVRKRLRSEARKYHRHRRVTVPWFDGAEENASLRLETDKERWHRRCDASEMVEIIYRLLSETEKSVFDVYFAEGLSIDKTAEKLNMSRGAVRGAIDRIRKKARRIHIFVVLLCICQWILAWRRNI